MTKEDALIPRKVETAVEGRCARCKEIIYSEVIIEDRETLKETRQIIDNREVHKCQS